MSLNELCDLFLDVLNKYDLVENSTRLHRVKKLDQTSFRERYEKQHGFLDRFLIYWVPSKVLQSILISVSLFDRLTNWMADFEETELQHRLLA